jgi:hypothetical protein
MAVKVATMINQFVVVNDPPGKFCTEEQLAKLVRIKDVRPGRPEGTGKMKHSNSEGGSCGNFEPDG